MMHVELLQGNRMIYTLCAMSALSLENFLMGVGYTFMLFYVYVLCALLTP